MAEAAALWESLPAQPREKVEAAPHARIIHDRFHVSRLLNEAEGEVRKEGHRQLLARGDESLTDTMFLWIQGAVPTHERALRFEESRERDLNTARAWAHGATVGAF